MEKVNKKVSAIIKRDNTVRAKIGIALGGGGARGLSHIGVLKVLERENFPINFIAGCSIGAIVGGLYALYQNARKVEEFIYSLIERPIFRELNLDIFDTMDTRERIHNLSQFLNNLKMYFSLLKTLKTPSIYNKEQMEKIFEPYPDHPITRLPIKFATISTDLISGREIVLTEGSLKTAVMASSAIPGILPPVEMDDLLLIDGASSDSIPVQIVKGMGAQYVIAVDVSHCLMDTYKLENGLDIIYRAENIVSYHLAQERLAGADWIIRPDVRHYSWAAVGHIEEIIKAGENAAENALPHLKKLLAPAQKK